MASVPGHPRGWADSACATLTCARSEGACDCLGQQQCGDSRQADVKVLEESFSLQPVIEHSPQIHPEKSDWQRVEVVSGNRRGPQSSQPVTAHANDAGGQKIA